MCARVRPCRVRRRLEGGGAMFASIHRNVIDAAAPHDAADFGKALAQRTGFVAALAIQAGDDVLFTITLFDDESSLDGASSVIEQWIANHCGAHGAAEADVTRGEVVAQRG